MEKMKPVMIAAHRGGMAYAPENTVAGFKNGQRLETDILELDVQVRGNDIFVLHVLELLNSHDSFQYHFYINSLMLFKH